MKLLTFREWLGHQGGHDPPIHNQVVAMVTELPLGEALLRCREYEDAYKARCPMACEWELIGVTEIDTLTDHQLDAARLGRVEDLDLSPPGEVPRRRKQGLI